MARPDVVPELDLTKLIIRWQRGYHVSDAQPLRQAVDQRFHLAMAQLQRALHVQVVAAPHSTCLAQ